MIFDSKTRETGQVIILMALILVVLLGFVALAIDIGMVYADRRAVQNAADAAALAGAGAAAQEIDQAGGGLARSNWSCARVLSSYSEVYQDSYNAAISRATGDGYIIKPSLSPSSNSVYDQCSDSGVRFFDVQVTISHTSQTAFLQLFYNKPVASLIQAKARVFPRDVIAANQAVVSLDTSSDCNSQDIGINFNGGITIDFNNGTFFSDSCISSSGSGGEVDTSRTGHYVATNGYDPGKTPGWQIQPPPTQTSSPLNISIDPPDCSSLPSSIIPPQGGTINPGRYTDINWTGCEASDSCGLTLTLSPGLYCVSGNISFTGGIVAGEGVTIYLTGNNSSFSSSSEATINLSAPVQDCDSKPDSARGCPPAIGGMLIYMSGGSKEGLSLGGKDNSTYTGTIYAPNAKISIDGPVHMFNSGIQLIGKDIHVNGENGLIITYNPDVDYLLPVILQLQQ